VAAIAVSVTRIAHASIGSPAIYRLAMGPRTMLLTTDFIDSNETGFQVLVKASPGPRLERANLINSEVSRFEAILDRDDRSFGLCSELNRCSWVSGQATCG